MTDKWGFRHTCYVATATLNLKYFHNSSQWTIVWTYQEAKIQFWPFNDFQPDCVPFMFHNKLYRFHYIG